MSAPAVSGGSSPHTTSTRRDAGTTLPCSSSNAASTARGFRPPSPTDCPSTRASTGPSSLNSTSTPNAPASRRSPTHDRCARPTAGPGPTAGGLDRDGRRSWYAHLLFNTEGLVARNPVTGVRRPAVDRDLSATAGLILDEV